MRVNGTFVEATVKCTVERVNGTLVDDKMSRFKGECKHFSFNKCPIYTHDGANAKFSTNSQEMDNSGVRRGLVGCGMA